MFRFENGLRSAVVRPKVIALLAFLAVVAIGLYPLGRYAWASVHYQRALSAIERRDFPESRRHLEICTNEWPNSAQTRFLAARTARRDGDLKAAQHLLKGAERLGWVPEAVELERVLLSLQLGSYQATSRVLIEQVRKEHPDSLLIVEFLSEAALQNGDLFLAAECLDWWTRLEPQNPRPFMLQGDVLVRLMRRNDALAAFRRAVQLAPEDATARLRCGELLLEQKYADEAKEHFQWLMERKPDDPAVRRGMANCLINLGQADEARRILLESLTQPDDAASMALLGQLELASNNLPEAEKWLRQAANRQPFDRVVLYNLADCLGKTNRLAEAESLRQRMERVEKDLDDSRTFFKAIAESPGDPEPRRQLAIRLMRNGQAPEAIRWLETGLRLDPYNAEIYKTLADCYDGMSDTNQAKVFRDRAKELQKQK